MTRKIEEHRNVRSHRDLDKETVEGIHETVKSAFGDPNFSLEETKAHIGGDVVHVVKEGDRVVGFSSTKFRSSPAEELGDQSLPSERGTYFAAAAVRQDSQGQGVYKGLNQPRVGAAIEQPEDMAYTRTQNRFVEYALRHEFDRRTAQGEIDGYEVTRHHQKGVYGRQLAQTGKDAQVDPKIGEAYSPESGFNQQRGDAHVLIFRIRRR